MRPLSGLRAGRLWTALLWLGLTAIPGVIQILQEITYQRATGAPPHSPGHLFLWAIPVWWLWIPLGLLVRGMIRRWPIDGRRWWWAVPFHAVASVALGGLHLLVLQWIRGLMPLVGEAAPLEIRLLNALWTMFPVAELLAYWVVVTTTLVRDGQEALRERELRTSRLETELARAELSALRSRLHPHFLFNTLNAITVLMEEDRDRAREMVLRLADLLRHTLRADGREVVPLAEELATTRRYLAIEEVRFADRLRVEVEVPDDALGVGVPTLLLQPLVENALRHGLAPSPGPGTLAIRAARENGCLHLEVEDDGVGIPSRPARGVGLSVTASRLLHRYGDDHALDLEARSPHGTRVHIRIPAEEVPGVDG